MSSDFEDLVRARIAEHEAAEISKADTARTTQTKTDEDRVRALQNAKAFAATMRKHGVPTTPLYKTVEPKRRWRHIDGGGSPWRGTYVLAGVEGWSGIVYDAGDADFSVPVKTWVLTDGTIVFADETLHNKTKIPIVVHKGEWTGPWEHYALDNSVANLAAEHIQNSNQK